MDLNNNRICKRQ